jgi:hypothetical protein
VGTELKDITIHCVCKHEPFIYYAIKAVYDFCTKILLYDTGSTDIHTLKDIEQLLFEDKKKKIVFKQIQLGFDEEKWSLDNLQSFIKENKNKMSVGKCRQMQLDETYTKYFMIVDGDEVHYKKGMHQIINNLLPSLPENKYQVGLPLTWFYNLDHIFNRSRVVYPYNGRITRTDMVYMNDDSPNEFHLIKGTTEFFTYEHPNYLIAREIVPYAHFESVFKPWRRKKCVLPAEIDIFKGSYPEVIVENRQYWDRYKALYPSTLL